MTRATPKRRPPNKNVRGSAKSPRRNNARTAPAAPPPAEQEVERLRQALEDLQVAQEELQTQNNELLATQNELRWERQRYLELFEAMPDAYVLTTLRGYIRQANQAAAILFGWQTESLIGKPLVVFVSPPQALAFRFLLQQLRTPPPVGTPPPGRIWEARLRRHIGGEFEAEFKVAQAWEAPGKLSGLRWLIRDVTERKRAAARLEEQASLLNLTHDTIIVRDLDGRIVFWNEGAREMYGWVAAQARGQITHELLQTKYPESLAAVERTLLTEGRWEGELTHTRRDGTRLVVSSRQVLKRSPKGEPEAVLELNTDITAQKEAAAELVAFNVELEARVDARTAQLEAANQNLSTLAGLLSGERDILQTIMENTDAQIAYLDPQFNFIRVNSPYAQGSGHTKEELLGRNYFEFFPDPENRQIFEQVRDAGAPVNFSAKPFEFPDQPAPGRTYWNWTLVPVKNDAGQVQGLVLSLLDVTPSVLAQQELVTSNLSISSILGSITDAYVSFDREWRFTDVNPAAERMIYHRSKQELVGQVFWDVFPETRGNEISLACERAAAEQHPVHLEAYSTLSGKWLETHIYPERDGVRVYYRDISERKREEETRSRLAAIVESSDDAIIGLTLDGRVQSWNPGAERLFGYTAAEMVGQSVALLYPPDHVDEFPGIVERLKRGEPVEHYETHRLRRGGIELDASVSISPIRDGTGALVGASKLVRDITAEKRARQAERLLAEASALLASSLDYEATLERAVRLALPFLADYVVVDIVERDGSVRQVTVAAADPARDEALRTAVSRVPPLSELSGVRQALQSGQPQVRWEIPAPSPDLDPELKQLLQDLDLASSMVVPMLARDRALGTISLARSRRHRRFDAADLTVAEDLARRAAFAIDNARLYHESQAALVARDEFLSVASHEVRTPLTVIQGYTQLLKRQAEQGRDNPDGQVSLDRAKLLRTLQNIDHSTGRLITLISDLLDVSRMQDRPINVAPERINLKELIWGVVERMRTAKQHHEHLKSLDLQVDLAPEEVWGEWDRGRIEQVVLNLVDNAIKYSTASGRVQVRLDLEEEKQDGRVVCWANLTVRDQGIGIPPGDMDKMFQPFVRASNAIARHYPGLGLGLAVSHEIVKRHGGRMWVESAGEDQGSTFHVALPLDR